MSCGVVTIVFTAGFGSVVVEVVLVVSEVFSFFCSSLLPQENKKIVMAALNRIAKTFVLFIDLILYVKKCRGRTRIGGNKYKVKKGNNHLPLFFCE